MRNAAKAASGNPGRSRARVGRVDGGREATAPRRTRPLVRWLRASWRYKEWILVLTMALAAAMSAFAFWQSTELADEQARRRDQERVAATDDVRESRSFLAMVASDLDLVTRRCAATVERDAALVDAVGSEAIDPAAIEALVARHAESNGLFSLLQKDAPTVACVAGADGERGAYSLDRAVEYETASEPTFTLAARGGEEPDVAEAARGERRLMAAAVAFAVALMGLSLCDLPGQTRRGAWWRGGWAAISAVAIGVGAGVVVVESGSALGALWLAIVLASLGLCFVACVFVARFARRVVAALRRRPGDGWSAGGCRDDRRPIRWWAEMVGALTLVAFAITALGLSVVSQRERSASAAADRLTASAERLFDEAQEARSYDVDTLAELTELDARRAGANQAGAITGTAGRIDAARAGTGATARWAAGADADTGDGEPERSEGPGDGCARSATRKSPDYEALFDEAQADPYVVASHLVSYDEAGTACSATASLTRSTAAEWGERATTLTVALLLLGLGAFLLALAADQDRDPGPARWLLASGAVGVLAGVLVAAAVPLLKPVDEGHEARRHAAFARSLAAGKTAMAVGDCRAALDHLDDAIARVDSYAPAHALRARARLCSHDEDWLVAPSVDRHAVEAAVGDADRAVELGHDDPADLGDRAWLHLLGALSDATPSRPALRTALGPVREAKDVMEREHLPGGHAARFNLALAELALGDPHAEASYRRALDCLTPTTATCPGGGLDDPGLRTWYRLSALDDLELLEATGRTDLDRYREMIVPGPPGEVEPEPPASDPGSYVAVFPQDLEVRSGDDEPVIGDQRVFYYRKDADDAWDVMAASAATVSEEAGATLAVPAGRLLPPGEYRADLYVDGRASRVFSALYLGNKGFVRTSAPRLGIDVAVPRAWRKDERVPGVEVAFTDAASGEGLVLRREEGRRPPPGVEVGPWLEAMLDDRLDAGSPAGSGAAGWFLGLNDALVHVDADGSRRAAVGFSPYAADAACGGTVFTATVEADTPDVAETVYMSLFLHSDAPIDARGMDWPGASTPWRVEAPDDWVGGERPADGGTAYVARECGTGASLEVAAEDVPANSTLGPLVDERLEAAATGQGYVLDARHDASLDGGEPAIDVRYREVIAGTEMRRWRRYVVDGDRLYTVTLTGPSAEPGRYGPIAEAALASFAPRPN